MILQVASALLDMLNTSTVSLGNSSSTPLAGGATFTGTWQDLTQTTNISIMVSSDVASATDGMIFQQSTNGVDVDDTDVFTLAAGAKKQYTFGVASKYGRVVYANGASPQATFRLQTMLHKAAPKPSSHRIKDSIIDDDDAELVKAVMTGKTPGGSFINASLTTGGNFKMAIEEVDAAAYPFKTTQTDASGNSIVVAGAATGVKGVRVYGGPTDPISDVPVYVDFSHHQVHEGESHEYCYLIGSLASGVSQDFRINVPAGLTPTTRTPHFLMEVISTLEAEIYLYEAMTYTVGNGGTLQTSYNRNRNSATTPATTIYLTPTPATTGTQIWIGLTGSGVRAGSGDRALTEWDLAANKDYLFRITSRAAGNKILVRFLWYEDLGV